MTHEQMLASSAANSIRAVEVRSVDESLKHAHDATQRAQAIAAQLLTDLNGASVAEAGDADPNSAHYGGIVSSADRLAGRLESLVRDLSRARSRIVPDDQKIAGTASGSIGGLGKAYSGN